jgi:hypothetical protein
MTDYYNVFVRDWWTLDKNGSLLPGPGRKTYLRKHVIREDALALCRGYNHRHDPGLLSRKAEFEPS